jgi:hypothetical protein
MAREKPLDFVQAWLAAWNERDVFSDAAVNHLRSLITEAHCLVVVTLGLGREPRSLVFRRVKRVLRRAWCRRPGQLRAWRCIGLRRQCAGRYRLVHWRDLDRRGVAGTVGLLRRSLAPGGMILIGEVCWRREPPDQATVEGCGGGLRCHQRECVAAATGVDRIVGELGCDVVEMVLAADSDSEAEERPRSGRGRPGLPTPNLFTLHIVQIKQPLVPRSREARLQNRHRFSRSFCCSRNTFGSVGGPSLALVKLFPLLSTSGKRTGIIGARPPTWICSI